MLAITTLLAQVRTSSSDLIFEELKVREALISNLPGRYIFTSPVDFSALSNAHEYSRIVVEYTGEESFPEIKSIKEAFLKGSTVFTFGDIEILYQALDLDGINRSYPGVPDVLFAIRLLSGGAISDNHIMDSGLVSKKSSLDKEFISIGGDCVLTQTQINSLVHSKELSADQYAFYDEIETDVATAIQSWLNDDAETNNTEYTVPGNAWEFIYYTRWSALNSEYRLYLDQNVHKLVDNSSSADFFLHSSTLTTEIVNPKPDDDAIQWLVDKRHVKLDGDIYNQSGYRYTQLLEHGPTTTVPVVTSGFSIGASVSTKGGFGLSTSYSENWSNPCITTTDYSNNSGAIAEWEEQFSGLDALPWCCATTQCTPSKTSYYSKMAAIFKLESGIDCPSAPCKVAVGADASFYHMKCALCVSWSDDDAIVGWDPATSYIQWGKNFKPIITNHVPESSPQSVNVGGYLDFYCTATDSDGCGISYNWYKDDHPVSTGQTWRFSPTCDDPNTVTIKVIGSDPRGATDQYSWSININKSGGIPGTPSISGNSEVCGGSSIQLTASASGNPTSWSWSSGCGGTFSPQNGNPTNWTAPNGFDGNCQVSVTASSACGTSGSGTKSVTVKPLPGKPDELYLDSDTVDFNESVTLFWDPVENVSSYNLYENDILIYVGSETSITRDYQVENNYIFALKACNECQCNDTLAYKELHVVTIDNKKVIPNTFVFHQNYPNPFNPSTVLHYELPETEQVSLIIYDISGRKICTLVNSTHSPGDYSVKWSGKDDANIPVGAGTYIAKISAGEYHDIVKILFLK